MYKKIEDKLKNCNNNEEFCNVYNSIGNYGFSKNEIVELQNIFKFKMDDIIKSQNITKKHKLKFICNDIVYNKIINILRKFKVKYEE